MEDPEQHPNNLTRRQLYDLVWQTPMRRLTERFGFSDVAIAKMCKRHHVPRPPRGHWARLEHGKPVEQPPLPEVDDPALDVIRVGLGKPREVVEVELGTEEELPVVEVAPELTDPHRLVAKTERSISGAKPDERGGLPRCQADLRVHWLLCPSPQCSSGLRGDPPHEVALLRTGPEPEGDCNVGAPIRRTA